MEINDDKFHNNYTVNLLYPALAKFGKQFMKNITALYKQGIFCFDVDNLDIEDCLFIVVNIPATRKRISSKDINSILKYLSEQKCFEKLYIYDVDTRYKTPHRIVIAIKMPDENKKAMKCMIEGNFGMMYDKYDIKILFNQYTDNVEIKKHNEKIIKILSENKKNDNIKIENETLSY